MKHHVRSSHRHMTHFFLTASLLILSPLALAFGPQSSTKAQEWGFDFVEEFDGLQDWDQSGCRHNGGQCGGQFDTIRPERMPRIQSTGAQSAFGFFSVWSVETAAAPWIGSETASGRKIWRGTKSATIDIGETNNGPSRLGLHFGEGYQHWSVFYMVWIPKNMFPTSCEGGSCGGGGPIGTYTEGLPYRYFASFKFNTFSIECNSSRCPVNDTYGEHTNVTVIKQNNYGTPPGLELSSSSQNYSEIHADDGGISLDSRMGNWWGLEISIQNVSPSQYRQNIWVYDANGTPYHVLNNDLRDIPEEVAHGGNWDHFLFGGNNSNSWDWGPTMQSHYYVDDLIIDAGSKGQIGPRYFSAIGVTAAPPSAPADISGRALAR